MRPPKWQFVTSQWKHSHGEHFEHPPESRVLGVMQGTELSSLRMAASVLKTKKVGELVVLLFLMSENLPTVRGNLINDGSAGPDLGVIIV